MNYPARRYCFGVVPSGGLPRAQYFTGIFIPRGLLRAIHAALVGFTLTAFSVAVRAQVDLTSGLVAYFPLNGNANDASGNGNSGTVIGLSTTADRFGNAGGAFLFEKNGYLV